MNNIRVAILDTGIADELCDDRIKLKKRIRYDYCSRQIKHEDVATDYNGHGTMCVNTIWDVCPNVDIYAIDMLGIAGITNGDVFCQALEYASSLDVDIISVCASFIVNKDEDKLKAICKNINNQGITIVASVQNGMETSAIANFDSVIGVIGSTWDGNGFTFSKDKEIQMNCDDKCYIIPGKRLERTKFAGNSRSSAIATGIIAELIYNNYAEKNNIIDLLEKNSMQSKKETIDTEEMLFDEEREQYLVNTEERYHEFIYLLCEFFVCNEPAIVQRANLLDFKDRRIHRYLDCLIRLIEERFSVDLKKIDINDLVWAYKFYDTYLR